MKRIFAMLVAIMLLMNISIITVVAEDNITLNVDFDGTLKTYTVSGFVDYARDRIPMSLVVKHENGKVLGVVETLATGKTDEGISFTFPVLPLKPSTPSGNIEFKVTAGYLGYVATETQYYYGADRQLTELTNLKNAIELFRNGDEDTLKAVISSSKEVLSVDDSVFLALSDEPANTDDASSIALRNISLLELNLPDGFDTAAKCIQIAEQIVAYHNQFKEANELGKFFDFSSKEDIKAWYDANKEVYDFLDDDNTTAVDDTKLLPYFDEVITRDGYVLRIDNVRFVKTMQELNIEMKKQAVLQMVAESNHNIVSRVITELSPMLSNVNDENGANPVSLNLHSWNMLTLDEQSAVCMAVAGKSYSYLHAFINDVNAAINNAALGGSPVYQGPSTTPSRGDKGGSKPVAMPNVPIEAAPIVMFEDIEEVAWAEQAIHYLYTNKIITGRNEKTFAPDDMVTRAELAKMLVLAFNLEGASTKSFKDVKTGAWYADYVGIAAANGLILGDDSGRFNPDKPVSRQDAAVMMYRALGTKAQGKSADFLDYDLISSYAAPAINYMYENGIVNGVGDGNFAPLANITRAQAAKMMYSLLVA